MQELFKKILTSRVYEAAIETPLDEANELSKRYGNRILLKREDQQPVFSFKIRGAYNKIATNRIAIKESLLRVQVIMPKELLLRQENYPSGP